MLKLFMYFETVNDIFKFSIIVNVVEAEYLNISGVCYIFVGYINK